MSLDNDTEQIKALLINVFTEVRSCTDVTYTEDLWCYCSAFSKYSPVDTDTESYHPAEL